MWKRWSLKPPAAVSEAVKSPHTGRTANQEGAAPEPSVKPDTVAEAGSGDAVQEVTEFPASTSNQSVQPADEAPEVQGIKAPVASNPSNGVRVPNKVAVVSTDRGVPPGSPEGRLLNDHALPLSPENETILSPPPAENHESTSPSDTTSSTGKRLTSTNPQSGDAPNVPANTLAAPPSPQSHPRARRLSFRSLAFFYGRDIQTPPKSSIPPSSPALKSEPAEPVKSKPKTPPKPKLSRSEKHALSSAVALRTLIIGPGSLSSSEKGPSRPPKSKPSKPVGTAPPPDLKKLKSELLKPKSANAVIAQLRRLPLPDGPTFHDSGTPSSESLVTHPDGGGAPIHAVCLACTDEEAEQKHFSRLRASHTHLSPYSPDAPDALSAAAAPSGPASVGTASLESLVPVLRDLRLVSLLASPDLGFGQPVSDSEDSGILSGSVPSPGALSDGFEQVTKQLLTLGFATSKAVFPSHAGIYPPEDRMSVLTYWWGLELVLPEPSVKYLSKAKSISNSLLNFLSALALFNNGVREVLPFIRYVANFVDFEWSAIKAQDKGRGVVCAATWVMPAAMVPRPWDFPSRPDSTNPGSNAAPTTPAPKTTIPQDGTSGDTSGANPPSDPPPQDTYPETPPNVFYPPAPALPMLPQLMITPATLPRSSNALQDIST